MNKLFTLGAMARRLGVETKWLREEAASGLPHIKAGKTLLFDVGTVEQILLNRAGQPPQDKPKRRPSRLNPLAGILHG